MARTSNLIPVEGHGRVTQLCSGTLRIFRNTGGSWEWELSTRAGAVISRSNRGYVRRNDAKRAATAMLNAARSPRIVEPPRTRRRAGTIG